MLLRYFHTLRHLRAIQFINRLRRYVYTPAPDFRLPPVRRVVCGVWCVPCQREPSMLGLAHFCFLNEERLLVFPEDWNSPEPSKLWIYNLHYFDDLNARSGERRRVWHESLIRRWIADNPPARTTGWDPYPLSLRIVNWIKWALSGNNLTTEVMHSLAIQARQLRRNLEFHLLGNHLFENAKALVFAGIFFCGKEAEQWLLQGKNLLDRQIQEQVLGDGGHVELSPMYHALVLEGLLDILNLYKAFQLDPPVIWLYSIENMFKWLRAMCHPDGKISFFNDAAFGVAPSLLELRKYATCLGISPRKEVISSQLLEATGYARLEVAHALLIADVAEIGPKYLPGHSHADTLSFELSLFGQRVLVNSGTSVYGVGPDRLQQRGTAAHNTVRLDRVDSSEVWSGFRVARRASVKVEQFNITPESVLLQAVHDGYKRLIGRPKHRRRWLMWANQLELYDSIEGAGHHIVELFFYFHPSLSIIKKDFLYSIQKNGVELAQLYVDPKMLWRIEDGFWHPQFGIAQTNSRLIGEFSGEIPVSFSVKLEWRL